MHQLLPTFTRSYSLNERTHTCNALARPPVTRWRRQRHTDDWKTCSTNMRMQRATLPCSHLTHRAGRGNSGLLAHGSAGLGRLRPGGTEQGASQISSRAQPTHHRPPQCYFALTPVLIPVAI